MDDLPEPTPLDTSTDGFQITDEGTAGWAVSTRRHAETRMQHRDAIAGQQITRLLAEIDEVTAWLDKANTKDVETVNRMTRFLTDYLIRTVDEHPKTRSVLVPGAKLVFKPGSKKLEAPDPDQFIAWAKANGHEQYLRRKPAPPQPAPEVAKDEFKKRITDGTYQVADDGTVFDGMGSGEVIPGVRLVTGDDQFIVEMGDAPEVAA